MFDPYHKWLGIPKDQRPPTHYQLLGLSPDEQDPEVIEEAAIRQTTHIRAYQMGAHAAECTRILNEIAKARLTLLNPAKRKDYDLQLPKAGKGTPKSALSADTDIAPKEVAEKVKAGRSAQERRRDADEDQEEDSLTIKSKRASGQAGMAGAGLFIGIGAGAFVLLLMVAAGVYFLVSGGDAPGKKEGVLVVQNDGKDDKRFDKNKQGNDLKDKNEERKFVQPAKDNTKKPEAVVKVIQPDPGPTQEITLETKGKATAEVVVELPSNTRLPSLSPDGTRLVYGRGKSAFILRHSPKFDAEQEVQVDNKYSSISVGAWSLDGKTTAFTANARNNKNFEGHILLWDWPTMKIKKAIPSAFQFPRKACFSPDGGTLVYLCDNHVDKKAEFWCVTVDIETGQELKRWKVQHPIPDLAFSSDGSKVFVAMRSQPFIDVFDLKSGEETKLSLPINRRYSPGFSPDGSRHIAAFNFSEHHVANPENKGSGVTMKAPDSEHQLASTWFSPDNRLALVSMTVSGKPPDAYGQAVLVDLNTREIIAATPARRGVPSQGQIAANGMAIFQQDNMHRVYRFPLAAGMAIAKNDPPVLPAADGFMSLFNGKDLTGLRVHNRQPGDWRVENGILIGTGGDDSYVYAPRSDYKDFHLRLEARIDERGVCEINFRNDFDRAKSIPGTGRLTGYRAILASTKEILGKVGTLHVWDRTDPASSYATASPIAAGEWFTMEVIAQGKNQIVKVNGKTTVNFVDKKNDFAAGHIFFRQALTGLVEFRRIEIRETSPTPRGTPIELASLNGQATYQGRLELNDPPYKGKRHKLFLFPMAAGNTYQIDMKSKAFDTYLHLEDPDGNFLAEDDDGGGNLDAKLVFNAAKTGKYRIMSTSFDGKIGEFTLSVRQTSGTLTKKDVPPVKPKDPLPATVRAAVPEMEKVEEAEKTVREQFKKDYAKKGADLAALAEKFIQLAKDTNDDPTSRYVLLREARQLATKSGRAEIALKAAVELIEKYDLDDLVMRVDTLTAFTKYALSPELTKQFVEVAVQQAANAQSDDHFAEASKLLGAAEAMLKKAPNAVLLTQVQKLDKQIREMSKEHAEMKKALEKLEADPKDVAANEKVGAFYTFRRGNWEKGLVFLALSGNAEYVELAKKDAAAREDDKLRYEAAEAWFKAADKKPAHQKAASLSRSGHWFRQALPGLTGLNLDNATVRLKQIDATPDPFRTAGGSSEVDRLKAHSGAINWLSLSADGKRVFSAGVDGTVREWNFTMGKSRLVLAPQITKGPVTAFAITPDERTIALLNPAGNLSFNELGAPTSPKFAKTEKRDVIPGFFWSSNSDVSYADKKLWHSWGMTKGAGNGIFPIGLGQMSAVVPRAMVQSPDNDYSAIIGKNGVVATYPVTGGSVRGGGSTIKFDATAAAISKDAKLMVLGNKDGNLRVVPPNVSNPTDVVPLKGHTAPVRCAAFTPDGKQIITGGDDRMLRVWDAATGKELQQFVHPGSVTNVVITPDNRYAISAGADAFIRMWKLPKE